MRPSWRQPGPVHHGAGRSPGAAGRTPPGHAPPPPGSTQPVPPRSQPKTPLQVALYHPEREPALLPQHAYFNRNARGRTFWTLAPNLPGPDTMLHPVGQLITKNCKAVAALPTLLLILPGAGGPVGLDPGGGCSFTPVGGFCWPSNSAIRASRTPKSRPTSSINSSRENPAKSSGKLMPSV